ncbi:MAG: DUF4358 domain-containing protein [Provencibacterium sp.]|nr:DUF4358 domain-containing protein [Provencibacterium sp.]
MKKTIAVLLAALPVALFSACRAEERPPEAEEAAPVVAEMHAVANPEGALEEIYAGIDIKEIEPADDQLMESLGFDLWDIEEYAVRYSSGRYGLADVFILRPHVNDYDSVRESLETVKLDRIRKTEEYDVLGSHRIAEEAQIYQYGSYLIMLMLEDNSAAAEIVQRYIPSTEVSG